MRCCAYEKASCEDDSNGYATEEFSGLAYWAIAVLITIFLCFVFTHIFTGKPGAPQRRIERVYTSRSYWANFPVARVNGDGSTGHAEKIAATPRSDAEDGEVRDEGAAAEKGESEPLISRKKVACKNIQGSSAGNLPVAERIIPPVFGIRRPPAISHTQPHLFGDQEPGQTVSR